MNLSLVVSIYIGMVYILQLLSIYLSQVIRSILPRSYPFLGVVLSPEQIGQSRIQSTVSTVEVSRHSNKGCQVYLSRVLAPKPIKCLNGVLTLPDDLT